MKNTIYYVAVIMLSFIINLSFVSAENIFNNFKVEYDSDKNVVIEFSAIDEATEYKIYRSIDNGEFVYITSIDALEYIDDSTVPNKKYTYKIVAINGSDTENIIEKGESETLSIIKYQTKSGGVTGLNLKVINQNITINYNLVPNAVIYQIYRSTDNKKFSLIGTSDKASYTDNNTIPNIKYYYKLSAIAIDNEEEIIIATSSILSTSYKLLKPTITLSNSSYTSIKLSWAKIKGASGYEVYQATSLNGRYTKIATVGSTTLSYNKTKLSFNRKYYYKIRAYQVVNGVKVYSAYSDIKNIVTKTNAPTLTVSNSNYNTLKLTWNKVSGASGYSIERYDDISKKWTVLTTVSSATTSYNSSSLVTGREYTYRVRAYRTVSKKKYYGIYSASKKLTPIPALPSTFTATSFKSTELYVGWAKVAGATGYKLVKKYNGNIEWEKDITDLVWTNYVDNEVILNEIYTYEITAYRTINGINIYGNTKSLTKKSTPLSPSIDVVATGKKVFIEYTYTSLEKADGFVIKRSTSATGEYTTISDIPSSNQSVYEYTDYNVIANTTYYYHVYSYKLLDGERVYSEVTTKAIKNIPYAPSFVYGQKTYNSLYFEFARYSDDDVVGYEIYRATTKNGTYTKIGTTTSDTYLATGLTFGSTYYFKVRAYTIVNGIKIYGSYQELTYKVKIDTLNNFPETNYMNDHMLDTSTIKFKSVTFKKISISGNYVTYEIKVSVDLNALYPLAPGYFVIKFYGMDMNTYNIYDVSSKRYDFSASKAGLSSKTFTFTVKVKNDVTLFYIY